MRRTAQHFRQEKWRFKYTAKKISQQKFQVYLKFFNGTACFTPQSTTQIYGLDTCKKVYYSQVIVKKNTFNVILNKLSKKLKIFKVPFFFLSVSTFLSTITSRVSLFSGLFMFWFALSRSLSLPVSSHLSSLFFCVEVGCVWSKARLDAPCHRKIAHLRLLVLRTFALTLLSFSS